MNTEGRLARMGLIGALGLALVAGCNPAGQYGPPPTRVPDSGLFKPAPEKPGEPKKEPALPVPADYLWSPPNPDLIEPAVPIVFVTEQGSAFEWNKLTRFWNYEGPATNPRQVAALVGLSPLVSAPLAAAGQVGRIVKIKVPRGLPDPTRYVPGSNMPTVGKWALGKRLFFDDSYLSATDKLACATCHQPEKGFTDNLPFRTPRTAPLLNVVFNRYLFWDGRANALEEVVQRQLDDERPPPDFAPPRPHVWSGVIERLRKNPQYRDRFGKVFGTEPTQDAVGKALATYLRTILAGDSAYDQAEAAREKRKAQSVEEADFAAVLKDAKDDLVKALDGEPGKKADLAKRLATGAKLFHDTGCMTCHPSPAFHDNSFHNLGIGESAEKDPFPGHEPGRFAALPVGEKDPRLLGAYKTPSLRCLPRTMPYFHDASQPELFLAVVAHVRVGPAQVNPHLDPLLRDEKDPSKGRDLHLKEDDIRALVSFLKALDAAPEAVVRERDTWPEGTTKP
jgi:cytochrome c peroxidase